MLMYTVVLAVAAARVTLDTFSCFCHLRAKEGWREIARSKNRPRLAIFAVQVAD